MSDDIPELPQLPDVSDLKTFDVPDPPLDKRGSKATGLVKLLIAAACALAFTQVVKQQHMLAIYASDSERSRNQSRAFRRIDRSAVTLNQVLSIRDPSLRGAFHEQLADAGDPAQAAAILAYVDDWEAASWSSDPEDRWAAALPSLKTLNQRATIDYALQVYNESPKSGYDPRIELRAVVIESLKTEFSPEQVLPSVVAIPSLPERGAFYEVLSHSEDPTHIDAILAYVSKKATSMKSGHPFAAVAEALKRFGVKGTPKLEGALQSDSRPVVNLAAEVLKDTDLPFLLEYTSQLIDGYDAGRNDLIDAHRALDPDYAHLSTMTETKARQVNSKFEKTAYLIGEILKALTTIPRGNAEVDLCFARGLSTFNQDVAELSARTLKQRLSPDELVDTLFQFIANKSEFSMDEVGVYEGLILELGTHGGDRVAANMERLLKESQGHPDNVFWFYKVMGFQVLKQNGTRVALPVLDMYAADSDGYVLTGRDARGNPTREEVMFADMVREAREAIRRRSPEAE
ncbi:hypothetical protein OAX78_00030 [Planctomycetota bacterium]|nr:hypothetical protein [Planctomycetota bacterium]